jgi:hypothetical protein
LRADISDGELIVSEKFNGNGNSPIWPTQKPGEAYAVIASFSIVKPSTPTLSNPERPFPLIP